MKRYGHHVDFSPEANHPLDGYDLVHLVHISLPHSKEQYLNCRRQDKKFIVKTLWYPDVLSPHHDLVRDMAADATLLTVESPGERAVVVGALPGVDGKCRLLHPGVASVYRKATPLSDRWVVHSNGLYVPIKNVMKLLHVCKKHDLPVVLAGWKESPHWQYAEKTYYDVCRLVNYGLLLGPRSPGELNAIYNSTKVYVCPSRHEINSLSVGEAITCGCLVVSSNRHLGNSNYDRPGYWVYDFDDDEDFEEKLLGAYRSEGVVQGNVAATEEQMLERMNEIYTEAYNK